MNAHSLRARAGIAQSISSGIARRGFYIVSTPEEIPGCRGDKHAKLSRIQKFADAHGWKITVHNGNGWILFSTDQFLLNCEDIENGLSELAQLIETSFPPNGSHYNGKSAAFDSTHHRSRHPGESFGSHAAAAKRQLKNGRSETAAIARHHAKN